MRKMDILVIMVSQNITYSPIQEKAIALLSSGVSITDTAKECEVSRDTVYQWMKLPGFKDRIWGEQATTVTGIKDRLKGLLGDGVDAIQDIVRDPKHRNNKNLARIVEILFKSTGVLEQQANQLILILPSSDPSDQVRFHLSRVRELLPVIPESEQLALTGEIEEGAIDAEYEDVKVDADPVKLSHCPILLAQFEKLKQGKLRYNTRSESIISMILEK